MTRTLTGLLIALLIGAPAFAQEAENDADSAARYFDRLDQKKQGFITAADMNSVSVLGRGEAAEWCMRDGWPPL